ncbi:carboxylesterase family protein, partial [Streptomyces sp. T-3]|nr:carboxylesterase family protein [Streptomyces sp. T-3]
GPACPQTGLTPPVGPKSDIEDCLSLNVTTPRTAAAGPRPVMVYLHGGDHTDGSGAMNGAERLAARGDVIVVTVNYRLGALGYLAHPDLEKRGESGNYGFLDQQAALRWVKRNAAAFGGDPGNVTLFGESGGGHSTCAHLVAPSSAALFHRAITQSAPCEGEDGKLDRAAALKQGEETAAALGKDWRTAEAKDMVHPFGRGPEYAPVYGGKLLPRKPQEAFATGRFNKVPVLQGINHDESQAMVYGQELYKRASTGNPEALLDEADYLAGLEAEFGAERVPGIAARYPVGAYGDSYALALSAALTDGTAARATVDTGRSLAAQVPTYSYEFNDTDTPWYADGEMYPKPSFEPGAGHLAELPYLFELAEFETVTGAHRELGDAMIRIWTDFARTGEAPWKRTTVTDPNVQSLASGPGGIRPVDFAEDHRYGFWKSLDN